MRALAAHVADLRQAIEVLAARCALRPGELEPVGRRGRRAPAGGRRRRGYGSAAERFAKTRRLAVLRARLAAAEAALAAGRPSMVVGGKRLWRTRNHLDAAQMTEQQWRDRWDAARMFLTADGETGKAGGNETIRVDEAGRAAHQDPAALADQLGTHVTIETPGAVYPPRRGVGWRGWRRGGRCATTSATTPSGAAGIWTPPGPPPPNRPPRSRSCAPGGCSAWISMLTIWPAVSLDSSGNPVGDPTTIEVRTAGLAASRRDGRVRAAITALLDHAQKRGSAGDRGGESGLRRRPRDRARNPGPRCTRQDDCAAPWPVSPPRSSVPGSPRWRPAAASAVIGVDAAYTSKWGNQHWITPLQQQTSDPATVTRHHGAAAAIGDVASAWRSGDGRQDPAADSGPLRALHRPGPTVTGDHTRVSSSGPPTHPPRGVPVHRRTPTHRGQHRSGRTGLTPAH